MKMGRGDLAEKYSMTNGNNRALGQVQGTSKHGAPCSCTGWTPMSLTLDWRLGVSGAEGGNECQGV